MDRPTWNWTFHGFEGPTGDRPVSNWIALLPDEARDELVDSLVYMQKRPNSEWAAEHFKSLEDALSEIRFRTSTHTYRIYGYFGPKGCHQTYTFLVGTEKKVSNQRDAKRLAKTRRGQIERGEARTYPFTFQE